MGTNTEEEEDDDGLAEYYFRGTGAATANHLVLDPGWEGRTTQDGYPEGGLHMAVEELEDHPRTPNTMGVARRKRSARLARILEDSSEEDEHNSWRQPGLRSRVDVVRARKSMRTYMEASREIDSSQIHMEVVDTSSLDIHDSNGIYMRDIINNQDSNPMDTH